MDSVLGSDFLVFLDLQTTQDAKAFKYNYKRLFTDQHTEETVRLYRPKDYVGGSLILDAKEFVMDMSFPNIVSLEWYALL